MVQQILRIGFTLIKTLPHYLNQKILIVNGFKIILTQKIINLKVVEYKEVKDIDEYIQKHKEINNLLLDARDYFEFKIDKLQSFYQMKQFVVMYLNLQMP